MKEHTSSIHRLLSLAVVFSMLCAQFTVFFSPSTGMGRSAAASEREEPSATGDIELYRTKVILRHAGDIARLEEIEVIVLAQAEEWALLLVTAGQMAELARLGYAPRETDELRLLLESQQRRSESQEAVFSPLLGELDELRAQQATERPDGETTEAALRAMLENVTAEQEVTLLNLPVVDSDGDGLTDTEEAWWCTDPNNPNSDGDVQGYTDGQEVEALLDFTLSRTVRWGYGPPFGPPNAWPDWNGQDGNPATPACNDGDYDTIPDLAEVNMVGTQVPEESTDGDKFDDGQELFGTTYCPGAPTSCGYGNYPRIEYWNYIKASMPTWVRQPGDNPFVAAFPVPEVYVVPNTWTVERVTTITTEEGQLVETSNSYNTTVTRGQGSSVANSVTWNEWEEVSEAVESPLPTALRAPQSVTQAAFAAPFLPMLFQGVKWLGLAVLGEVVGSAAYDTLKDQFSGEEDSNQTQPQQLYPPMSIDVSSEASAVASIVLNQEFDFQGVTSGQEGVQYAIGPQGQLLARSLYDVSYALSQPRFIETRTNGGSWGGSQTTTHEEYEEHSIGNTEQFTTGQNWSTAWAVNSSHAAELTFDYTIRNTGTEYAREITGLIFNIYLGDDTTPLISYPAWEQFPGGSLQNVFPSDPGGGLTFSSNPIPLTLEQMKRIDLGERLTVVLEDFSYGADELFYQDAVNGGITFFIEDGVDDGSEEVDMYVIPTWGVESVQDVLGRYFPVGTDSAGQLNSLTTPEFSGTSTPVWNEHFLSNIAWWNIYLTQVDAGNTPLHELPAEAGSALLLRFNRDSDRDGYHDRVEWKYGTDKDDPTSHPQPEILAGYTTSRTGNEVTALLKLANSGSFDAYGIDAVMYAPDSTTTITNNTVGGNGRVRPGADVAVGSWVQGPELLNWTNSTAHPYATGNFDGSSDRVITFTVSTAGTVGQGSTALSWVDSDGGSGSLDMGASYHAPLPLEVANGVEVGLDTGTLTNGERFAVRALTPRDTFRYTINSEPYTPPVIVVSYSDPQGSHRFVTPVELGSLEEGLAPHAGQMLGGIGLEIATQGEVDASGTNTTTFTLNSPHPAAIVDGHLYLNFVADGELVAELPYTMTVEAGPSVYNVSWSTSDFSQPYDPAADNILIAFWTDAQGNIIDSAARPLNSFQEDPQAELTASEAQFVWNIGTARQGTLLQRRLVLANTGFRELLEWVGERPALSISGPAASPLLPADMGVYTVTLNTEYLPVGPYTESVSIRTSDTDKPTRTLEITGGILPFTEEGAQETVLRPLDWTATISGTYSAGEWVTFTHTLGPDPATLHPIRVFSEGYGELLGVGRYATDFSEGTAPGDMFGDGRDGAMPGSGNLDNTNGFGVGTLNGTVGATTVVVTNRHQVARINPGDVVLIHQTQGAGAGNWELNKAVSDFTGSGTFTLEEPLEHSYLTDSGSNKAQIMRVPQYSSCNVTGTVTPLAAWNGTWGGLFAVMCQETMSVGGMITADGYGFRGGIGSRKSDNVAGQQGESFSRPGSACATGTACTYPNDGGGGGGGERNGSSGGGGGAGHGSAGGVGTGGGLALGKGGSTYGDISIGRLYFGSGGGGGYGNGSDDARGGNGGRGGGILLIWAHHLTINGTIKSNGTAGSNSASYAGGGASGGTVRLVVGSASLGTNRAQAIGGAGGTNSYGDRGGNGGVGRIHVEYCDSVSGSSNPAAVKPQLDCYMADNTGSPEQNVTHLQLPESVNGNQTYAVQYGRQYVFGSAGEAQHSIRLPKQIYTAVSLEAMAGNINSGGLLDLTLDIGADGIVDWGDSSTTTFPASLVITDAVSALNRYLVSRTDVAWGDEIDIPIRVSVNRAADIILTNLALTPVSSKTRYVRLEAQPYASVELDLLFEQSEVESGALSFTVDVGADGLVDWSWAGSTAFPAVITSEELAAAFNSYLAGHTGEVDVPVRIVPSPFINTTLATISAIPDNRPDLAVADVAFGSVAPSEGDAVSIEATVHNLGNRKTETTVAFFATPIGGSEVYIGSSFLSDVPTGGSAVASIAWDTADFTGVVPVRVVIDPYNRINENIETNNASTVEITILAKPDLEVTAIALDKAARQGVDLEVAVTVANHGETGSGAQNVYLYSGDPDTGGALVGYTAVEVAAGANYTISIPWTPEKLGPVTLYAVADGDDHVSESDENNNQTIQPVYVGWGPPLAVDAGGAGDSAYESSAGYGYLTPGTVINTCGNEVYQTYRQASSGTQLQYRFDHLLPGRYYHLDLTFYLCSGSRDLRVLVDGIEAGTAVASGTGQQTLSLLLDPATYSDNSIVVAIEKTGGGLGGPVVSELVLSDIRYCYRDSGAPDEVGYSDAADGCGWLNGDSDSSWGSLPHETVRFNEFNPVQYRFDDLENGHEYRLNLTFYEEDGAGRVEGVVVDGTEVLSNVMLSETPQYLTATVPAVTYDDGSIVVQIVEGAQPVISEIALEEVTAALNQAQRCYTLARTRTGLGAVPTALPTNSVGCPQNQYVAGEVIQLTAAPALGWQVGSWEGTDHDTGTESRNQITMPATSRTVVVRYEEDSPACYTLTRAKTGAGAVPDAFPANSASCPTDQYIAGEVIQLTAAPAPDWHVGSWDGTDDDSSVAAENQVTMPAADLSVTVYYVEDAGACYQLTRMKTGVGAEPDAAPDSSIGCPADQYVAGEVIHLTASPGPGWHVNSWEGTDNDGSFAVENQLTMPSEDRTVTVHYEEDEPVCYRLTRERTGMGSVPIASPVGSPGCAPDEYTAGEVIQLAASPDPGWYVSSWSGTNNNASAATTNVVTMPASSHTVIVQYGQAAPVCYVLTLTKTGMGAVPTVFPASSSACETGQYVAGEMVELAAVPDVGWHVGRWSGTDSDYSVAASNRVTMPEGDRTVTVMYEEDALPSASMVYLPLVNWRGQ